MRVFPVLLAGLLGTACVGTLEPVNSDPGGDDTAPTSVARQMFDDDVRPMLTATCAGCHVGATGTSPLKFLGAGGEANYYATLATSTTVVGGWDPAQAELLLHGLHDGGNARAWTTTEADAISMWLLAEADER